MLARESAMSVALYPTRTRAPRGVRTSATSASPLRGPARVPLSNSVIFAVLDVLPGAGGDRVCRSRRYRAREEARARALSTSACARMRLALPAGLRRPVAACRGGIVESPAGWHRQTVLKILARIA